jgi:FkbM family methyltransferase
MAAHDEGPSVVSDRDDYLDKHLAAILDRLGVEVVVDVGASYGQYRGLLRKIGFSGRIVSFEPLPGPFEHCAGLAVSDPAWTVHRLAVGRRDHERTIKVGSSDDFSSFLGLSSYGRETFDELSIVGEERVQVRALDSLWPEFIGAAGQRVFLKTDTQGWDLHVYRGARRHLSQVIGTQCELAVQHLYRRMPGYRRSLAFLERRGFALTGVYPVWRDARLRIGELDCVMVRSSAMGVGQPV